jgi:hypothetical protein
MSTLASLAAKKGWRKGRRTRELIRERGKAAWLDSKEFYEVMQAYRHAYVVDQAYVAERFEAVKNFIRSRLGERND